MSNSSQEGAFTPDVLRVLRQDTRFKLRAVLAHELSANVGVVIHPRQETLVTAYYGAESRLDLWSIAQGERLQSLWLRGEGDAGEMTGVMIIGPNGPVFGSPMPIRNLALSRDGTVCAVACGNTTRLITLGADGRSMSELIDLKGDHGAVHGVAYSHGGDLLASVTHDGKMVLWSVATNQLSRWYQLENAPFKRVAFSHDDLLVAAADADGNVAVWDIVTGSLLAHFQAHAGEVGSLAFAPRGYLLATGGFDGSVRLWDLASSAPFGLPMMHGDSVYDVAFSQDGVLLYTCSFDQNVGVWRLDNQEPIDVYEDDAAVLGLGVFPDDRSLALVTSSAVKILRNERHVEAAAPGLQMQGASLLSSEMPALRVHDASDEMAQTISDAVQIEGELLVGEIDADYLKARRAAETMRTGGPAPLPEAPPMDALAGFSQAPPRPGQGAAPGSGFLPGVPVAAAQPGYGAAQNVGFPGPTAQGGGFPAATSPGMGGLPSMGSVQGVGAVPGIVAMPGAGASAPEVSGALTPMQGAHPGAMKPPQISAAASVLKSAIPPETPEARAAREAAARKRSMGYIGGAVVALVMALIAGYIAAATAPGPESSPEYEEKLQPIEATYQTSVDEESARHAEALRKMTTRLDKIRNAPDAQGVVAQLEGGIEAEKSRHDRALEDLKAARDRQVEAMASKIAADPTSRVFIAAILTFIVVLVLMSVVLGAILNKSSTT